MGAFPTNNPSEYVVPVTSDSLETWNQMLMDHLKWYAKKTQAEYLVRRCMAAGKIRLAARIAEKYGVRMVSDDTVTAIGFAMMSGVGVRGPAGLDMPFYDPDKTTGKQND